MRQVIRPLSCLTIALAVASCAGPDQGEESDTELVERARAIHERVITIDTHVDIESNFATDEVDPLNADRQVTLEKMREGGLNTAFFAVYVGQTERTPGNYEQAKADAMTKFEAVHRMADEMYPDQIEIAYSADDVERIHAAGKLVAAIGIENGYAIGKDLSLLERYHELGGRYITLAHNGHNDISDSGNPRPDLGDATEEHGGLSEFGEQVVAEMNRLGILVDISHISKDASLQAMRVSRAAVIASHSSTKALADVSRNLDDEQLMALKENGGVMQTVALGSFVKVQPPEYDEAVRAIREEMDISDGREGVMRLDPERRTEYDRRVGELDEVWPPANLQDYVNHIDYAVDLIGIDYVGISSDFDGGGGIVGWRDASESLNLTVELVRRGYTEDDIRKLWGGNTLRVWREAEKVAAEMQGEG
ncbi:MAG: pyoverdine-tailoring dipeptidase-like protein PvdM [Gemmatimonadota bacterium]|nr:MAG: pyoverdine-tailoring dipeptidase-like protein PvdM [Gemmatimonadota bacterium]